MKKIRNIALILLMTLVMVTSVPCVAFAQEEGATWLKANTYYVVG